MLRLSKRIEYGLLAMQDMASNPGSIMSVKDLSERYSISAALLAKVLQLLVRDGIVRSYAGPNGGYSLARDPGEITISNVIAAIEGYTGGIVECQDAEDHECSTVESCTIREPLGILQERIKATFQSMTVQELSKPKQLVQLEVL